MLRHLSAPRLPARRVPQLLIAAASVICVAGPASSATAKPPVSGSAHGRQAQRNGAAAPASKAGSAPAAKPATAAPAPGRPPAAPAPKTDAAPHAQLAIPVQKITLDNGLRVIMSVDHTSPTVAVAVTYDVGARNEERGRSGFAHLFEHMMFEGSANVPKGEHFKLVSAHGGNLNGTTSSDRTNYFEMLPSSELALALWLEADRMKSLNVSAENFENQRKVVQEEYRMRVSNVAYAPAQIRLSELVFQGYWPYEHDPIGSMQDLDNAQLDWVRAFHDSHYAPNLAVLAIAGDFEADEATQLVHRFFDTGKKQEKVVPYDPAAIVEQTAPRTASLEDAHAKTPAFYYGYAIPPTMQPDHYAVELAMSILTDGESSRMHQRLVRDKALAQEIGGWTDDHRGPDMAGLEVKLAEGARLSDGETAVDAMLDAFAKDGPTDAEMTKVKNRTEAAFLFGLQSNLQRATKLGQYELFWGDARLLNAEPDKYFAVTKDDIKRVMAKYLTPARRTIVDVRPAGMVDPPARKPAPVVMAPAATPLGTRKTLEKTTAAKTAKGSSLGKEREGGQHKPRHRKDTP
jgi:zinc protease